MRNTEDKFSSFIVTSAVLHVALVAFVLLAPELFPSQASVLWGSDSGRSGSIKVGMVSSLPGIELPSPPVVSEDAPATDSKSLNAPEPAPKPQEQVVAAPEVLIPSRGAPARPPEPRPARGATKVEPDEVPSNAVPGAGARAAVPYGQSGPGGQATFGDEAFGQRYGAYVQAMTQAIRDKWQQGIGGLGRGSTPRVYVTFTIQRSGSVTNVEIDQKSGNSVLDNSALRAVLAATIPPLPRDYAGSSVDVRFYFEYVR